MLSPEEIQSREFATHADGYAKADVRAFLDEVAAQLAALGEGAPPTEDGDGLDALETMGTHIATVLRAAKETAESLVAEAEERLRTAAEQADERLETAGRDAEELLTAAEAIRTEAVGEAAQLRADAEQILASAHQRANHIQHEASERAERELADTRASVQERLNRLSGHETAIRDQLLELADAVRAAHGALSAKDEQIAADAHA